mgnify:CR=1 FL=1
MRFVICKMCSRNVRVSDPADPLGTGICPNHPATPAAANCFCAVDEMTETGDFSRACVLRAATT